jgi:hypothetical protein
MAGSALSSLPARRGRRFSRRRVGRKIWISRKVSAPVPFFRKSMRIRRSRADLVNARTHPESNLHAPGGQRALVRRSTGTDPEATGTTREVVGRTPGVDSHRSGGSREHTRSPTCTDLIIDRHTLKGDLHEPGGRQSRTWSRLATTRKLSGACHESTHRTPNPSASLCDHCAFAVQNIFNLMESP